jgi:hypothetical protein
MDKIVPIKKIDTSGATMYMHDGLLHREDGPAVEYLNGDKEWRFNGRFHRLEGPALIIINPHRNMNKFFIMGIQLSKQEFDNIPNKKLIEYNENFFHYRDKDENVITHCIRPYDDSGNYINYNYKFSLIK